MKRGITIALILFFTLSPASLPAQVESLYLPRDAEWGSTTGWDHRYPGVPGWVPATVWQETFNRKYVELLPGETYTLVEIEGPGIINRVFFTLPVKNPRHNLRGLVLKVYWDDEENPSVLSPVGDFFGAAFGKYIEYDSQPMSMQGGGMVCRFHMPFKKRARIEIENGWERTADWVFFGINWYQVPSLPEKALYFHALWRRTNPTAKGEPYLVAEIRGRGNFAGLQLYMQNLSTFWYRDFFTLMQPEGFGMGNLEGWEEVVVDGRMVQHGTGTEEYFNSGAYFASGSFSGIYEGVHVRSYLTGRTATYRFQVLDPVSFEQSFTMIWHHGPLDSIRSDYSSVAYWYQSEPHLRHEIPCLKDRLPESTAFHAAQAVILAPLVFGNQLVNSLSVE